MLRKKFNAILNTIWQRKNTQNKQHTQKQKQTHTHKTKNKTNNTTTKSKEDTVVPPPYTDA